MLQLLTCDQRRKTRPSFHRLSKRPSHVRISQRITRLWRTDRRTDLPGWEGGGHQSLSVYRCTQFNRRVLLPSPIQLLVNDVVMELNRTRRQTERLGQMLHGRHADYSSRTDLCANNVGYNCDRFVIGATLYRPHVERMDNDWCIHSPEDVAVTSVHKVIAGDGFNTALLSNVNSSDFLHANFTYHFIF